MVANIPGTPLCSQSCQASVRGFLPAELCFVAFLIFLPEGDRPLLSTLDLRLVPGLALFSPNTRAGAALPLGRRAGQNLSAQIFKDHPHYPDILSLRQGCPSLASYYGTCSFLDGMSAIVVGSLCRNQVEEHMPSQPLPRCSMRLLFSSIHCYLDPSSVRLLVSVLISLK